LCEPQARAFDRDVRVGHCADDIGVAGGDRPDFLHVGAPRGAIAHRVQVSYIAAP
jgi:hypothetical protein